MNPRGEQFGITEDDDEVEELKGQIEEALRNVEEIKKNNAIVSVLTKEEQTDVADDEIVLYVSVKVQKNQKENGKTGVDSEIGLEAENGIDIENKQGRGTCMKVNTQ